MRNITLVLFLLIGTLTAYSQDKALRDKLVNNWKKTDITAIDGSPYYDEETLNLDLDFNIISKDSLYMFNSNLSLDNFSDDVYLIKNIYVDSR